MTIFLAIWRLWGVGPTRYWFKHKSTTRTSWMANNAIPDSNIMNIICRSLGPPVELNEPNVRSTEVALTSRNTLRILNTIKPVTRAFTTMDAAKPVIASLSPQVAPTISPSSFIIAPSDASQVARGENLKSAYQTKIYSLTYICDCRKWRNNHHPDVFTPHDPTTVDMKA